MGNKFFQPGDQRSVQVRLLFDAIARRYDLINDLQSFGLHRYWKRRLIRLAHLKAGDQALDLCCGTGDIALALAQQGARVVGLDFSDAMLAVARRRALRSKLAEVKFVQADALRIPYEENAFDVVTIGYGLRNLASCEAGLREMLRVTRPGGRLLVLDFGRPENRLWCTLYFAYLRRVVPIFGWLFCGNATAYAYILESLQNYPAQHGVAEIMRQVGSVRVEIIRLLGGMMSINCAEKPG
jgi:demethylmenaquinone methyltransferase/2-methoxy-6-polyprenyl-1,4-benzoquinol methylase